MTKIRNSFIILLLCIFASCMTVKASDDGFIVVNTEAELDKCLAQDSGGCRLASDLILTTAKEINGTIFLDLNGHLLQASSDLSLNSGFIFVNYGGKLTIDDKVGTGKITSGKSGNVWGALQLTKNDNNKINGAAELVINGGTIEGYYYGVVGNGNRHNTILTINGGTIKTLNDESVGIFQPQDGITTINNGSISGGTAIEIRAGNLTINNGNIKATNPNFNRTANSNGSTTDGVGVTVAQHTTKKAINVIINNGTISGSYAFYEWNPQKNSQTDIDKVSIQIKGGEFYSTVDDGYAVYSEDFRKFISGGKFNTEVNEYLTDDAKLSSKVTYDNAVKLNAKKSSNNYTFIFIVAFLALSIIGFVIYYKYNNSIKLFKKN